MPGEFELIARYFAPLSAGFDGAFGLKDDAAVFTPRASKQIVATTDAIIAGVHFALDDPPDIVARKALRVNLSDLAAKGAVPLYYLLDLILPQATTEKWAAGFARGLACDQKAFGVHLIGGDTNATPGPLTVAVMALGEIRSGEMLRRGGAHAGDAIFVTGTIGDAALGLAAINGALPDLDAAAAAFLVERCRLPLPRLDIGPRLIGLASASIDISDGLVADLGHVCEVSGLVAELEAERVPLSTSAQKAVDANRALLRAVLTGGDDYEILFTAPELAIGGIEALGQDTEVPITLVGRMRERRMEAEDHVRVRDPIGATMELARSGWAHF